MQGFSGKLSGFKNEPWDRQARTFPAQTIHERVCRNGWLLAFYEGMSAVPEKPAGDQNRRRYVWPRYVLAAFIAAILLAALWLSFEIRRTQRIQRLNEPGASQGL
jgi:hypothetical protein